MGLTVAGTKQFLMPSHTTLQRDVLTINENPDARQATEYIQKSTLR